MYSLTFFLSFFLSSFYPRRTNFKGTFLSEQQSSYSPTTQAVTVQCDVSRKLIKPLSVLFEQRIREIHPEKTFWRVGTLPWRGAPVESATPLNLRLWPRRDETSRVAGVCALWIGSDWAHNIISPPPVRSGSGPEWQIAIVLATWGVRRLYRHLRMLVHVMKAPDPNDNGI